jgi:hypothetical protein
VVGEHESNFFGKIYSLFGMDDGAITAIATRRFCEDWIDHPGERSKRCVVEKRLHQKQINGLTILIIRDGPGCLGQMRRMFDDGSESDF